MHRHFGDALQYDCTTGATHWLHVVRSNGADAFERVYQDTLAGRTHPTDGHIVSL